MQSENFDKKIKDSLSQRPPGNDVPAWDKMETLLDRHLPEEKKDRRRIVPVLFLFLLIGGGIFLIWQNSGGDNNDISSIESQNEIPASPKNNTPTAPTNVDNENSSQATPKKINDQPASASENTRTPGNNNLSPAVHEAPDFVVTDASISKVRKQEEINNTITNIMSPADNTNKKSDKERQAEPIEDVTKKESNPVTIDKNESANTDVQKPVNENKAAEQKPETKESQPLLTEKSKSQKQKTQRSFFDNLFFSLSAGPDFTTVGLHNAGKVKLAVGGGLGYRVSDKFSIRTGFYSARKVYTADPEDYDPPYNVAQYYPNLKHVDANCEVYEIPLIIDYTISNSQRSSWFASAGVSSLIMKEEKYDYYFKPNSSPTYITTSRTIKDQNKHYFSQLNISGGYTRNINNNFSLRAEPYMKIAMHGVGLGKVDLNSSGVLFSAIIKPFAKK